MNLKSYLNFSVDKVVMEKDNDSRFSGATIYAFADGENANTLPVDTDVLMKCSKTVYDIPIVCKYSEQWGDFLSHEEDEVPIGFVKESSENYDNPIIFTKMDDGRTFLTIKGLIWKRYSGKALEVLMRGDKKKSVSIEMQVTKGEDTPNGLLVKSFILEAITILGDFIEPAVKDAKIMMEFSKDKNNYLKFINKKFNKENKIDINNDKDSAVSGNWSNPRRKLFEPIIEASNKDALIKEAYLVNEGDSSNPEISKLKYPHHIIKNGELVLHIDGVQAAMQRASQQGILNGEVEAHLKRHYKELGLSMENFSVLEESVGENNMNEEMKDNLEKESSCEENMNSENCDFECENKETNFEKETEECFEENSDSQTDNHEEDHDEDHDDEHDDKHDEHDEYDEDHNDDPDDEHDDEHEKSYKDMSEEEKCSYVEKLEAKIDALQKDNESYMQKIEEMSDYEDLKKFKKDTEEKARQEEELSKMEEVMSEIENRGFSISYEDKKELMNKCAEFSSMDAWSNYVKALAFDKVSSNENHEGFALPFAQTRNNSIWDNI